MSDGTTTWNYTYNADGLRTTRSNGTATYKYIYNGSSLVQMTVGNDTLYFTSDTVTYNNTVYYYVKNIQGDVVAILDTDGDAVVQYTYDAWGNILTTTGELANTLGQINPLRYRSYVYDTETGLYYLQSRYYDPELGRFLNEDITTSTGGLLGNNMFAYCINNPIRYVDSQGRDPEEALVSEDDQAELIPDSDGYAPANTGQAPSPASGSLSRGGNFTGGKGSSLIKYLKGLLNISGSKGDIHVSSADALDLAINYLGNGYTEVEPGRYVSEDGTRQVRMADHDLACWYNSPHINFDTLSPYRTVHVYFLDVGGNIK